MSNIGDVVAQYLEGKIVRVHLVLRIPPGRSRRHVAPQDFEGQKLVEQISRNTLIAATVSLVRAHP